MVQKKAILAFILVLALFIGVFSMVTPPQLARSAVTYTITASSGSHATITPSGKVNVAEGADQKFDFSAQTRYQIASVTVNGSEVATTSPYNFVNVTANYVIRVTAEDAPDLSPTPTSTPTATPIPKPIEAAG